MPLPAQTPLTPDYALFLAGGAEAFLRGLVREECPLALALPPGHEHEALRSLDRLFARAGITLAAWAFPDALARRPRGQVVLAPGANPFRIEGHLLELERLGVDTDMPGVSAWRMSQRRQAERVWADIFDDHAGAAYALLLHVAFLRPFVMAPAIATSPRDYADSIERAGRVLLQAIEAAGHVRQNGPRSSRVGAVSAESSHDVWQVVVEALEAHRTGQPIAVAPFTKDDLMSLALDAKPEIRSLGITLASTAEMFPGAGSAITADQSVMTSEAGTVPAMLPPLAPGRRGRRV